MAFRAGISSIITNLRQRNNDLPLPALAGGVANAAANNAPAPPPPPAAAARPAAPATLASLSNATSQASGALHAATSAVHNPVGVAADDQGALYVADAGHYRIIKLAPDGSTTVVAGGTYGLRDGGPCAAAFLSPAYLALEPSGARLLVTDQHCVRRINLADGKVTTIAGSGSNKGHRDGPADVALFHNLRGLVVDFDGSILMADSSNHCIRKVTTDGHVITFAGCGQAGFKDGPGKLAQFHHPCGLAQLDDGTLLVADSGNNRIRMVDGCGQVSTLAGEGSPGYRDGQGIMAKLHHPQGLAVDGDNNAVVSDLDNHRIRMISPVGVVSTICSSGATAIMVKPARERPPSCSTSASDSNLVTSSRSSSSYEGTMDVAGSHDSIAHATSTNHPRDVPSSSSPLLQLLSQRHYPQGVAISSSGQVVVADGLNSRLLRFKTRLTAPRAKQRAQVPTLSSALLGLMEREELTDVRFVVEDTVMVAHSLVLVARCDYFRTMLSAGMQEDCSRTVFVNDVCASSFRAFLCYLYTDALNLDSYSVLDLLYLSRKYMLPHLTKACTTYVRAHLSCANALQWLVWAHEQVFEDLEQAALDFVRQHFVRIRSSFPEALAALTDKPELLLEIMREAALEIRPPPGAQQQGQQHERRQRWGAGATKRGEGLLSRGTC